MSTTIHLFPTVCYCRYRHLGIECPKHTEPLPFAEFVPDPVTEDVDRVAEAVAIVYGEGQSDE